MDAELLRQLYQSEEYSSFKKEYEICSDRFKQLSDEVKFTTFYCLHNKGYKNLNDLGSIIFDRPLVSFEEFITNPNYAGIIGSRLYLKWREELIKFFNPNNVKYEYIFTGAIGGGKTFVSTLAKFYNIYKLCCLRHPQATFGLSHTSPLWAVFLDLSKERARDISLVPFKGLLESSPLFEKVRNMIALHNYRGNKIPFYYSLAEWKIYLFKNIEINVAGMSDRQIVGFNIFSAMFDEAEARKSRSIGVSDILRLYEELKNRLYSRFKNSSFKYLSLISSAGRQNGVIETYLNSLTPRDHDYTQIARFAKWELADKDPYKNGAFYVLRGTLATPSEVLKDEKATYLLENPDQIPSNCKIIKVPKEYELERAFRSNIDKALNDVAGEPTITDDLPFPDLTTIQNENLIELLEIKAPINETGNNLRLLTKLPPRAFVNDVNNNKIFFRYPKALRYCHVDQAITTEAGLTIVHKERGVDNRTIYVADLILCITSDNYIRLDSIYELLYDLHRTIGMRFHTITYDQFQSAHYLQKLKEDRISTTSSRLSVDISAEQYQYFANIISQDCFKCGTAKKLIAQLSGISIDSDRNKVRRDIRKDVADASAGAVWNASQNIRDIPNNLYEENKQIAEQQIVKVEKININKTKLNKLGFDLKMPNFNNMGNF